MKAVRIEEFGGPENLHLEEMPRPEPGPGQVLIRVHAASVNPVDAKLAANALRDFVSVKLPWTPGADYSGVVQEAGPDVPLFWVGTQVYGSFPTGHSGSYAEYVVADQGWFARKPKILSHVEAASLPIVGQTAWQALFEHANLQARQTLLVHGAGGGVGAMAIQLARWKKAHVLATASAAQKEFVRGLGVDKFIDYQATLFETIAQDVDVVLDLVGGDVQTRSYQVLKPNGYLISTVQKPVEKEAAPKRIQTLYMHMEPKEGNLQRLAELIDAKIVRPTVTRTLPLEDAAHAWREKDSRGGKTVLQIRD